MWSARKKETMGSLLEENKILGQYKKDFIYQVYVNTMESRKKPKIIFTKQSNLHDFQKLLISGMPKNESWQAISISLCRLFYLIAIKFHH